MSKVICVMGESGSGKTTSMRNLDPNTTYYIDADRKGLSWKGWREQYNADRKNYLNSDNLITVQEVLQMVASSCSVIKTVVIDTINGLMVADEMRRSKEKNYDKWVDLAESVWDLVTGCYDFRDDLTVIFLAHTETVTDDNGYQFTRIKTSGRKLSKIVLESKFTTVLLAECVDGNYIFHTRSDRSTCKTPMGAFREDTIDNDIVKVLDALKEY